MYWEIFVNEEPRRGNVRIMSFGKVINNPTGIRTLENLEKLGPRLVLKAPGKKKK